MVMTGLTPKQKQVLEFIESFSRKKGYSPSQQEIARHFGFNSLGTVQNYLVRLERMGALKKSWNGKRSLEVISQESPSEFQENAESNPPRQLNSNGSSRSNEETSSAVPLPILGRVAAGRPIEAIESGATVDVPKMLLGLRADPSKHYLLRVKGDSMIEDGICNDDLVVIRKQSDARDGQTVVAMISNEATIKKIYKKKDQIELHPANEKYQPIIVPAGEDFRIEGVLVGLYRRLLE